MTSYNKSQQQPVPQDVVSLCTDGALTCSQSAAGLSNYLYLQPDGQVDAQAQFAFGVMCFWLWTYKCIRPLICLCFRN